MKKILISSDLHCDRVASEKLVEESSLADIVIVAGDFANQHRGIEICVDVLKQIQKPTIAVPGNNETLDELTEACRDWPSVTILHGNSTTVDGVDIYGIGGGIPVTPFGSWSYDFSEDQAAEMLSDCTHADIIISHSPPLGHVDRSSTRQDLGSSAVFDAISRTRPQLVVCGHIHESWGTDSIFGTTKIINAGPQGRIVKIEK